MHYEAGGPAALAGVTLRTLGGERGMFTAGQVRAARRDGAPFTQRSRLVSVENTTNVGGGAVWDLRALDAVAAAAHENGLATHLDGARLMNAVVASGNSAAAFARGYDSAWIDMSKGLGAPVGGGPGGIQGVHGTGPALQAPVSGAPCARPASSLPPASMHSNTMWTGSPKTMPTPGGSPA